MILTFAYTAPAGHITEVQWYHDGVALVDGTYGGTTVSGATTTTLDIENPDASYNGDYYAIVTDLSVPGCAVQTDTITVTAFNCTLAIVDQPVSQDVDSGTTLNLSVTATGNAGTISYQWYRDGVALTDGASGGATISGATTANLSIDSITTDLAGSYTVTLVDEAACSVTSNAALVTVTEVVTNAISFAFFLQMVSQPDPANTGILTAYRYRLWDDPSGSVQGSISLACSAVGGGSDAYAFSLTVTQGGDSNDFTGVNVSLPLRTWHHIAVIYDGSTGLASLYVDAALVATTSGTPVTLTPQPYGEINMRNDGFALPSYADGYVYFQDLTGYWIGHGLTGVELTALYNSGNGLNGPPWTSVTAPTVWWGFDDAGRTDATEAFIDAQLGVELWPDGSCPQIEGLIDYAILKNGFQRDNSTDILASLAYTG